MKLFCDLETFSPTPIKHGSYKYAEQAEVMLWSWAVDDEEPNIWDLTTGAPMPAALRKGIEAADEYWWHNGGMFDRVVLAKALPDILALMPLAKWRDTMIQAYAHSLPGQLDTLTEICNVATNKRKLKTGKTLIQLFCVPRPANQKLRRATRLTHPLEWAQFVEYGKQDIPSMREVHKKLPKWNYPNNQNELALWHLDLQINDRGVQVDVELAESAIRAIDIAQKDLAKRTSDMTDGEVERATQRDKMLKYLLAAYGVDLPDMRKATIERRMNDPELPQTLRDLLAIRLEASMTSTSKYKTLVRCVCSDGRLRGTLQFMGAHRTGRWAARNFQPQNLMRPDVPLIQREMRAEEYDDTVALAYNDIGADALKSDCADLLFDNVMGLTGNLVRGAIIAGPAKKQTIADLANIEGRVLAWLAGENWKLKAFREYDAGTGPDLYRVAYARSFGVKLEHVTKEQRQLGKVQELALGYEGGGGAFVTMAMTYKMELGEIAEAVAAADIDAEIRRGAENFLNWKYSKCIADRTSRIAKGKLSKAQIDDMFERDRLNARLGLPENVFIACDILKRGWRQAHPETVAFWADLKSKILCAIGTDKKTFTCRRLLIRRDGAWLRIQLPSGRHLCYFTPRVDAGGQISYMGVHQLTRKFDRLKSYGGKFAENVTQAFARDVLAYNMPTIEAAGFPLVLSVHDELLTERDDGPDRHEELEALMATNLPWSEGLPLAAEGFDTYRYRK